MKPAAILACSFAATALTASLAQAQVVHFDNSSGAFVWRPELIQTFPYAMACNPLDITLPPESQSTVRNDRSAYFEHEPMYGGGSNQPRYNRVSNLSYPHQSLVAFAKSPTPKPYTMLHNGSPYQGTCDFAVRSFDAGASIGPGLIWNDRPAGAIWSGPYVTGMVPDGSFVGVRLTLADGDHYGYIQLKLHSATYQPLAWGYETQPNTPVTIPTPPPVCGSSDFDGDGDSGTDADIEAFFACLAGDCCATCFSGGIDFNGDGDYGTDADIESFFRVLAGGSC